MQKGTDICSYLFPNAIVGVQLNRDHAVVILEEAIFIHSLTLMEVLIVCVVIYLVPHCNLLQKIQVLLSVVVFVLRKMCEACVLHSRAIAQTLRWVVEAETQKNVK